eukprot:CAMPEP_0197586770 /NCGR_PEP_ID=MMETSP1326-20131121/8635_1 /TAXON_ID=1155430 /ORGANISM="Genus nov. species nov., Strain RCC2288" /LENGTH=164 /DNA_ID=CAMNT_0043151431 /DNA_START=312 /DNA_END=803 /DNA_ORIENTATION=-
MRDRADTRSGEPLHLLNCQGQLVTCLAFVARHTRASNEGLKVRLSTLQQQTHALGVRCLVDRGLHRCWGGRMHAGEAAHPLRGILGVHPLNLWLRLPSWGVVLAIALALTLGIALVVALVADKLTLVSPSSLPRPIDIIFLPVLTNLTDLTVPAPARSLVLRLK